MDPEKEADETEKPARGISLNFQLKKLSLSVKTVISMQSVFEEQEYSCLYYFVGDSGSGIKTIQQLELPSISDLPSEGVQYSSLPDEKIGELVDSLTSHVFHSIRQ